MLNAAMCRWNISKQWFTTWNRKGNNLMPLFWWQRWPRDYVYTLFAARCFQFLRSNAFASKMIIISHCSRLCTHCFKKTKPRISRLLSKNSERARSSQICNEREAFACFGELSLVIYIASRDTHNTSVEVSWKSERICETKCERSVISGVITIKVLFVYLALWSGILLVTKWWLLTLKQVDIALLFCLEGVTELQDKKCRLVRSFHIQIHMLFAVDPH